MTEIPNDKYCLSLLEDALRALRGNKPQERSDEARAWAVTITNLETTIAYFEKYAVKE